MSCLLPGQTLSLISRWPICAVESYLKIESESVAIVSISSSFTFVPIATTTESIRRFLTSSAAMMVVPG